MLSQRATESLAGPIRTLQVIIAALIAGVISFGLIAAWLNAAKPQNLGAQVQFIVLAISLLMLVLGFVIPRFLPKTAKYTPPDGQTVDDDPEVQRVLGIFAAIMNSTIVGAALIEGATFANLTFYLLNVELVHAAAAALCLVCILIRYPLERGIVERIEDQLQRQKDELNP